MAERATTFGKATTRLRVRPRRPGLLPGMLVILLLGCRVQDNETAAGAPPRGRDPGRLALLVGINRYQHPGASTEFADLGGCLNDAAHMAAVLTGRFGFPPGNVVTLRDAEATHERVVTEFDRHLIRRAAPGSEVVFFWAGHGSQLPDLSGVAGREVHGRDTTLVAYDSRAQGADAPFDITDDELHSLLRALCARGPRVTVITDCCHAGGATRGPASTPARGAPAGARGLLRSQIAGFWPEDVPFLDDDARPLGEDQPWVHIAACRANDRAEEYTAPAGRGRPERHGALSFFLVDELRRADPDVTFGQLTRRVAGRVATVHPHQEVFATGPVDRVLFAGGFKAALPGYDARLPAGSATVQVEAGSLHGLRPGSLLELLDLDRRAVGRARVQDVEPSRCTAGWDGKAPVQAAALALRAQEIERPAGDELLTVFVPRGQELDPVASALAERCRKLATVVRDPEAGASHQVLRPGAGAGLELWTAPDDFVLWRETQRAGATDAERLAAAVDALHERLAIEVRFRALLRLGLVAGSIPLEASIEPCSDAFLRALGKERDGMPLRPAVFTSGRDTRSPVLLDRADTIDVARICVRVRGLRDRPYITILSVTEYRAVNVVFPPPGIQESMLSPGSLLEEPVHIVVREQWQVPRPMRDRLLVIATERPADFSAFKRGGTVVEQAARHRASGTARGDLGPMPAVIEQALTGATSRGETSGSTGTERFGIACIDLLVEREELPAAGGGGK